MLSAIFCLSPVEVAAQLASMHDSVGLLIAGAITGAVTGVEAGYLAAILTLSCN